jgi:hypothetical protein
MGNSMIKGSQVGKTPTLRRDPNKPLSVEQWIDDTLNTLARQKKPTPYVIPLREAERRFPNENLFRSALEAKLAQYRQNEWSVRWQYRATGRVLLFTPDVKKNVL